MQKRTRQTRLITPGGAPPAPAPSVEEVSMMQWQALSQFWERYGNLVTNSNIKEKEDLAAEAYTTAAEYLRKMIDIAERSMEDEEE